MLNVMRHLQVTVQCPACSDSYCVSVETICESQRLVAEGCPGTSSYECPAPYFASLLDAEAVSRLASAVEGLEDDARLCGAVALWVDEPPPGGNRAAVSAMRAADELVAGLRRWENEGGRTQPAEPEVPPPGPLDELGGAAQPR